MRQPPVFKNSFSFRLALLVLRLVGARPPGTLTEPTVVLLLLLLIEEFDDGQLLSSNEPPVVAAASANTSRIDAQTLGIGDSFFGVSDEIEGN
jgi:hypothetical protein